MNNEKVLDAALEVNNLAQIVDGKRREFERLDDELRKTREDWLKWSEKLNYARDKLNLIVVGGKE